MSGSASSSSSAQANESFVLNIAFVHEATSTGIGSDSPHIRPRTRSIDAGVPSLTRAVSEVSHSLSAKDSPPIATALADVATASPHVPFGFISFPVPSLHTPANQVTLAQVRQILPSQFPTSTINNLISSGFITILQARALQSGSYLFLHAPSPTSSTFLPVSSVQESHIFAHQCQPTLLLKSIKGPNGPIGDMFGKDSLPSAANLSQRRQSYDLTLQHQDSLAMLDASGMGGRNTSAFASPRGRQPSGNYSDQMPSVQLPPPSSGIAASDDEKHMEEGERGMFEGISRFFSSRLEKEEASTSSSSSKVPLPVAQRVARPGGNEYRPLAPNLHFEDVIREKSIRHESPAPFSQGKEPTLKITVTGEILETVKQKREATEQSRKRRATNVMEFDEKEGSVKSFTNIEEFIKDEERRRAKYDAAAAAYLAAQATNETAASTIASDPTDPIKKSSSAELLSPGSGKEPLPQTPLWISVEDGDDRTVDTIGQYFGLHPLTIEDCQSKGIREKLEVFPEYLFLVFHALEETHVHPGKSAAMNDLQADIMKTTPLKLVVFPSLVLSFHKGGLGSVGTVRKQLDKLYRNRVLNTAWLIHGLLDVVSDSLMPVVDTAAKEADDMEDEVFIINPGRESHKEVLKRMGFIARRLTFLRQRLWSKRDILTSLIEKDWQGYLTGIRVPYLRDIYDHLVIMLHKMDAAIEVIVTLQNTYLAVVSIDVAAVSNEGNAAMKTLSAGATILLPLSLIASLMGMNVVVPFQYDMMDITFRDLVPFTSICLIMVIISFYLYLYFKRKSYL